MEEPSVLAGRREPCTLGLVAQRTSRMMSGYR
jgi:hypothetical protein